MRFTTLTRNIFDRTAGHERTWIREVTVPEGEGDFVEDGETPRHGDYSLLEAIFRYGQNDFQARTAPSLSVDDLIVLDDGPFASRVYRVASFGFEPCPRPKMTPAERLMLDFAIADRGAAMDHQFEEAERAIHAQNPSDPECAERFRKSVAQVR